MDAMKRKMVARRLEHIAKANGGRVTPEAVLSEAANPKSPLHDQFEWDDSKAAQAYRLDQARELIRSVRVDIKVDHRIVSTVRYVRDPSAGAEQGYVDVAKLRNSEDLSRDALAAELDQVKARMDRARSLAAVFGLERDIDQFIAHLDDMHSRLDKAA